MNVDVICLACGEAGSILVDDEGDIPGCPRCGKPLAFDAGRVYERAMPSRKIDDDVVSWVSRPFEPADAKKGVDAICSVCGDGVLMPLVSDLADAICLSCLASIETKPVLTYREVDCPGCGEVVRYSDLDRGKTIICRACNYFLGCLVPPEKHAYRRRREARHR